MKTNDFLCGVIEGYYGRPWSFNQRKSLFEYCLKFGLNTYVYAPKDDSKHRSRWRDLYSHDESIELSQLIHLSKRFGIKFVYALSPGLDIIYSSEKDLNFLKRKLDQLISFGCEHWALLFDDIENEMTQQDKDQFNSFAHAQVAVTNEIYDYLHKPTVFLFCPTEYCTTMAKPTLDKSPYLQTIGNGLHPDIDIFWTGPNIVSRQISVSHILSVNTVFQRRVTIWDNLNANDYDYRRLCLGPFSGRPTSLSSRLSGMLTNPNCEFELNFIPLNTLGQWFQSLKLNESQDQIDDNDEENLQIQQIYRAETALDQALIDWLPEFNKIKSACDSIKTDNSPQEMSPKPAVSSLIVDEDSQESQTSTKIHTMECDGNGNPGDLTIDDIRLLVEFFYLPFQHGPNAQQMLIDFHWLRFNYFTNSNRNEWHRRASIFHNHAKTVNRLLHRLTTIHNRSLFYDLFGYISDTNTTITFCSKYLDWLDDDQKHSKAFQSSDLNPSALRGGLTGEFLNLLPLGEFQSIVKPDITSIPSIYAIRSMNSDDQANIYALCTTVCYYDQINDLINQHSEILADKLIGGYLLNNNNDLCFVIEDNQDELVGFILTIDQSEKYDKLIQSTWISQIQQKYSNVDQNFFELIECDQSIYDQYPIRIQLFVDFRIENEKNYFIGNQLLKLVEKNLIKRGFHSFHTLVDQRNPLLYQFYLKLGFVHITNMQQNDFLISLVKQF